MSKTTTDFSREKMSWKVLIQNIWKSIYFIGHLEAISGEDRVKQEMINYCITSDIKGCVILMNYEILYVCRDSQIIYPHKLFILPIHKIYGEEKKM
jgi:hypothetical protein